MIGKSHYRIAEFVLRNLTGPWAPLLEHHREALDVGLEVPDKFMIWHPDPEPPSSAGPQPGTLVHRFYLDAENEPRGQLIQMILMYTGGVSAFAVDLGDDEDMRDMTRDMVLYTGILIHFLGDLCTPLHVGCSRDELLKGILGQRHHQKIEERFWRRQRKFEPEHIPRFPSCSLDEEWLMERVRETHVDYLALPSALVKGKGDLLREISERALTRSVAVAVAWLEAMSAEENTGRALARLSASPFSLPLQERDRPPERSSGEIS